MEGEGAPDGHGGAHRPSAGGGGRGQLGGNAGGHGIDSPPSAPAGRDGRGRPRARSILRQALTYYALGALPPPPPRDEGEGGNEYALQLFVHRRADPTRPLVLHDRELPDVVVGGPPHVSDQIEALTTILERHPGPVSSFRLDSSLCPDAGTLESWVEALSEKGVMDLVISDVYRDGRPIRFPLQHLRSGALSTLCLGFFDLTADIRDGCWCGGVGSLATLNLTGCSFPVEDLSRTVRNLGCLTTLDLVWCNLLCGPGTATGIQEQEARGLAIVSTSLHRLSFFKCTATNLCIESAPSLEYLEAGIAAHEPGAARSIDAHVTILLQEAAALRVLHAVALPLHVIHIPREFGPPPSKRRRTESLQNLTGLDLALNMCLPAAPASLLDLLAMLPAVSKLTISRSDDVPPSGDSDNLSDSWIMPRVPDCIKASLTILIVRDYRGGASGAFPHRQPSQRSTETCFSQTSHPPNSVVIVAVPARGNRHATGLSSSVRGVRIRCSSCTNRSITSRGLPQ